MNIKTNKLARSLYFYDIDKAINSFWNAYCIYWNHTPTDEILKRGFRACFMLQRTADMYLLRAKSIAKLYSII